jgi:hypothetical protein
MQRQTPNQKVFLLFLDFERKTGTKITHGNIDEAVQYVKKNTDSDIPKSELDELVLRYMNISPQLRTRDVITSLLGRALANSKRPKVLTSEETKEMLDKEKKQKQISADLKASAEQTDRQKQQDLTMAKAGEVERRTRETEERRQETVAANFGYGRPAPRPPYFVNPPDDEKLNDDCLLCQGSLSSLPVAFCRYCRSVMHLSCYNKMTPEQRKSLFTEQGLCRICKNNLKYKDVMKSMAQGRIVDDPTYFRWPPEAVFHFSSPSEKVASDRMLRQQQDDEYDATLAKDFVLPVLTEEELQEAGFARQQQEQQERLDQDEMRRMRLAAFEEYKKHADADRAAEMAMRVGPAAPLFQSLQRRPSIPAPAVAAPLRDEDIDRMLPDLPPSSSRFIVSPYQRRFQQQREEAVSNFRRATDSSEESRYFNRIMEERMQRMLGNEGAESKGSGAEAKGSGAEEKKGGRQNKYSKKKYIKRHSKKCHSKKCHSKKRHSKKRHSNK